jgi:SAM-dependent methyltransferase
VGPTARTGTNVRPDVPALGGHVREVIADPGSEVVVTLGKDPGMTTTVSKQAQPAAAPSRQQTARATKASPVRDSPVRGGPAPGHSGDDLFARYIRDYVTERFGQQIMILLAGCTTAGTDLGIGALRADGADIGVALIDDDQPVTRAAVGIHEALRACVQGDLRIVPLPPRSHDIVLCSLLLQRIKHAELVLDRLVAAIRPGGLLLLRFRDRDSAAGFLDRRLPRAARGMVWRTRRSGEPGPYPAVYERLTSARGVQAYALKRDLVITERRALGGLAGALAGPPGFLAMQKILARLSGGRLTDAHEELLYVLRKPENRFARVL